MWEQEIVSEAENQHHELSNNHTETQITFVGHEVAILSKNSLYLISLRSGNILWNAVRLENCLFVFFFYFVYYFIF